MSRAKPYFFLNFARKSSVISGLVLAPTGGLFAKWQNLNPASRPSAFGRHGRAGTGLLAEQKAIAAGIFLTKFTGRAAGAVAQGIERRIPGVHPAAFALCPIAN